MSKDNHYSVSATNRKLRKRVIANNVQEVLSEKVCHDEEILKAAYSKKKKTNKMLTQQKHQLQCHQKELHKQQHNKTTATKTSEAAGTATVKAKQKQSKLTSFFKL